MLADRYVSIRGFVDRDLRQHGSRPISLAITAVPPIVALLLARHLGPFAAFLTWTVCIAVSAIWIIFVGWRALRLLLKMSVRADEDYDKHGKYLLPSEYRDTESATSARRRRNGASKAGTER